MRGGPRREPVEPYVNGVRTRLRVGCLRGELCLVGDVVNEKVEYVRRQRQSRNHECHWPGCTCQVPPAMWGCKAHWFRLPKRLRDRIWDTYEIGQEVDVTPSDEYLAVAHEVQEWIRRFGGAS